MIEVKVKFNESGVLMDGQLGHHAAVKSILGTHGNPVHKLSYGGYYTSVESPEALAKIEALVHSKNVHYGATGHEKLELSTFDYDNI